MTQRCYCNTVFFCAAIARAAALGLEYPGVYSAAHYGPRTGKMPSRPQPYDRNDHGWAAFKPMMASYRQIHPGLRSVDDTIHNQAQPRGSESTLSLSRGASNPVQSEYTADPGPKLPRGRSVINRKSNFEGVKHAAPPVLPVAPGQASTVSWDPQGQTKPGPFVYHEHDLVGDESAPNRHGVFQSRFSLPRSQSQGPYHRGLASYGPGRGDAAPGSAGSASRDHIPVVRRGHAVDRLKRIWVPSVNVKQFVQGNPVIRRVDQN